MTQNETNKILSIIAEVYPAFRRDRNPKFISQLWHTIFSSIPYQQVEQALAEFYATDTKGYPPVPGALRELIVSRMQQEQLSDTEAWQLTLRAIRRGIYNSREEFDKLPPVVRQVVRNPEAIHSWAFLDDWQVQHSVAPWFFRAYNSAVEKYCSSALLPQGGFSLLPERRGAESPPEEDGPDAG